MSIQLTVKNLRTLAAFIDKEVTQKQLNMRHFRSDEEGRYMEFKSNKDCGTCGCALGWAPFVIPTLPADFNMYSELDFSRYGSRVFPALYNTHRKGHNFVWPLCFSGDLSSEKESVVERLYDVASRLEAEIA